MSGPSEALNDIRAYELWQNLADESFELGPLDREDLRTALTELIDSRASRITKEAA